MHLNWLGGTAVKLQTKHRGDDITLVIDPYKPAEKNTNFPTTLSPHIALFTRGKEGSIPLKGNPLIIDSPGEYEMSGIIIKTWSVPDGILFLLHMEQMTFLHLGALQSVPSDELLGQLPAIDILMLPVGGHETLSAKQSATLCTKLIEPRVCIPLKFKHGRSDIRQETVELFLKEVGHHNGDPQAKAIFTSSKLPQEELEVVVLSH